MSLVTLIVSARYCPNCDHTMYSRAKHDFNACPCWVESHQANQEDSSIPLTGVAIDGGSDYIRVIGKGIPKNLFLEGITPNMLHEDWNQKINKYGTLKGEHGITAEFESNSVDRPKETFLIGKVKDLISGLVEGMHIEFQEVNSCHNLALIEKSGDGYDIQLAEPLNGKTYYECGNLNTVLIMLYKSGIMYNSQATLRLVREEKDGTL